MYNSEKEFVEDVLLMVEKTVDSFRKYCDEKYPNNDWDISGISVKKNVQVLSGYLPVWVEKNKWTWEGSAREVDVVVGRDVHIDDKPNFVPLICIETKLGRHEDKYFYTDEINKKDVIYKNVKTLFPCLMTAFVLCSQGNLENETVLRNGAHFDRIISNWDDVGISIFEKSITSHLEYSVCYWGR